MKDVHANWNKIRRLNDLSNTWNIEFKINFGRT